jgi:membrane-bound ClpP family serine protease
MKYETIYTAKNKHVIYYRFTCEHCGSTTPWYPIEIEREAAASSGTRKTWVSEQIKQDISATASAAVQKRIDTIREQVEKDEFHIDYTPVKDEGTSALTEWIFSHYSCPSCKAYPSWVLPTLKKQTGSGFSILLGLGLPGVWFSAILLASTDWPKQLGGWVFGIAVGLFIIGLVSAGIINAARINKHLKKQDEPVKKLLPEINWNGR